jgi:hypothetical protein
MLQISSSLGPCTMLLSRRSRLRTLILRMLESLERWPSLPFCAGGLRLKGRPWGRLRRPFGWQTPASTLKPAHICGFMCIPNGSPGNFLKLFLSAMMVSISDNCLFPTVNCCDAYWPNIVRNYEIDWKSRVVATTDSYVVLNKPAATAVCFSFLPLWSCCLRRT